MQPAQQILGKRTNMMQLTDIERELFFDRIPDKVESSAAGLAVKQETSQSQNQIKMAASKSSHSSSFIE